MNHLAKRPYLAHKSYLKKVKLVLVSPQWVYESLSVAGALCYYRSLGTKVTPSGQVRHNFVKVVVQISGASPAAVRTTYYDDAIEPREHGQTTCVHGKWP